MQKGGNQQNERWTAERSNITKGLVDMRIFYSYVTGMINVRWTFFSFVISYFKKIFFLVVYGVKTSAIDVIDRYDLINIVITYPDP